MAVVVDKLVSRCPHQVVKIAHPAPLNWRRAPRRGSSRPVLPRVKIDSSLSSSTVKIGPSNRLISAVSPSYARRRCAPHDSVFLLMRGIALQGRAHAIALTVFTRITAAILALTARRYAA